MTRVVFDIETVGEQFEALDAESQEYLLRFAETEEEQQQVRERLGLYPLFGQIVAIGLLNPDSGRGEVHYQAPGGQAAPLEEDGVHFVPGSEPELLERFWRAVAPFDQIVTFNGRGFDCPYILARSMVHGVRPTRELMPPRYRDAHLDLLDQLCFFGATRRFSLDIWCRKLGIVSPKAQGVTGADVGRLFAQGEHLQIARYCARDLAATAALLGRWERFGRYRPA